MSGQKVRHWVLWVFGKASHVEQQGGGLSHVGSSCGPIIRVEGSGRTLG